MTEGMEHDFASKYVVAQAILAPPDAPLSFSLLQAFEFLMGCRPERPCGCSAGMAIIASSGSRSLAFLCDSFRNSRSNDGVVPTRKLPFVEAGHFFGLVDFRRKSVKNAAALRLLPRLYS